MSDRFELHVFGAGTCALDPTRSSAAYGVAVGNERMLMELGNGALYRQLAGGFDCRRLGRVFISHAHPDHVSDLMMLIQANLYGRLTPEGRLDHRTEPLEIIGPPPVFAYLDWLQGFWGGTFVPKTFDLVRRVVAPGDVYEGPGFVVRFSRAQHFVDALSLRFEAFGRALVFSGDTDVCDALVELSRGADTVLYDCSLPRSAKVPGHMTAWDCGRVAAEARAGTLVCTHINPVFAPGALTAEVREAGFAGRVIEARDGMVIPV